jgi:fluoride exporter
MPVVLGVALGGALGATARYGADRLIERTVGGLFPWSTFTINVTGCFMIGLFSAAFVDRHHLPAWLRIGIVMGVIGGYTTFSTFAAEALDLDEIHHVLVSSAYVVGSVALGMAAVYAGTVLGDRI